MLESCVPAQHCTCSGGDGCFGCDAGRKWLETSEGIEAFAESRGLDAESLKKEREKAAAALEAEEHKAKEQVLSAFNAWDQNGDGFISENELRKVLAKLGMNNKQISQLFKHADLNHDHMIDYDEFVEFLYGSTVPAVMKSKVFDPGFKFLTSLKKSSQQARDDKETVLRCVERSGSQLRMASNRLRDDPEVVLLSVSAKSQGGESAFRYASKRLQHDDEVMLAVAQMDPACVQHAGKEIRDNQEFMELVISIDGSAARYASQRLKHDPCFARKVMESGTPGFLDKIDDIFRDDKEFVLAFLAQGQQPSAKMASERLWDDEDVARAAINVGLGPSCRLPFLWASDRLKEQFRDNKEFVMAHLANGRKPLATMASERLWDDEEVVLAAINLDADALLWGSDRLKEDLQIVKAALKKKPGLVWKLSNNMKDNEELVLLVIVAAPQVGFDKFSEHVRDDPGIVRSAITAWAGNLSHASERARNDPELVQLALAKDGSLLRYASEALQDDIETVTVAARQHGQSLEKASARLKDDVSVVMVAVGQSGESLMHASKRLQNDSEVVTEAVRQQGGALQYASEGLQDDPTVVRVAVGQDDKALKFASARVFMDSEFENTRTKNYPYIDSNKPVTFQGRNKLWYFPAGIDVGASAIYRFERSESYTGRIEMRSSSHEEYALGIVTAAEAPFTSVSIHWQRHVTRKTTDDYGRDGERDFSDTGYCASAPRASATIEKFHPAEHACLAQPGKEVKVPEDAEAVLNSIQVDAVHFTVELNGSGSTSPELLSLQVSSIGTSFEMSHVAPDLSVGQLSTRVRQDQGIPPTSDVRLHDASGNPLRYWDPILSALQAQ